jgi:hypothetical protein
MAECSECGRELPDHLDFDKEKDVTFTGEGIETELPCECGKMYTAVYSYYGIWDPDNEEYVVRS